MSEVYGYLQFNNVITFNVHAPNVLGSVYQDVKVLALLDVATAADQIDPYSLHANVYPSLPPGVEDDPTSYQYVKVQHPNGTNSIIGIPWIDFSTITLSGKGKLTIVINDVNPDDKHAIMRALASNGYTPHKVYFE